MSIIDQVFDAGVVGAGGAGFPTHIKINCSAQIAIANGAECEPLLRVDQHVMVRHAQEIVRGLLAVMEQTGAKRGAIATKAHYEDAVEALRAATEGTGIVLHLMRSYYPAGDEQEILYDLTGKVVPTGGLPIDVGAVVLNVSTLVNIARAMDGKPVTDKYVTVGGAVANPVTISAPIGAPIRLLIEAAGGMTEDCTVIIGGPAMGTITDDLETVVTKMTGGVLCIPRNHPLLKFKAESRMDVQLAKAVCCQCMMCSQLCPRNAMGLNVMPHKAMMAAAYEDVNLLGNMNGIFSCCDCGICTYFACNFGLKPSKVTQGLKAELLRASVKPKKENYSDPDNGKEGKKVPTSRLMSRMRIGGYDMPAPLIGKLRVSDVKIPLRMHIGAPDTQVVHTGDTVQRGQLIAEPQGMGAKIHASIGGRVKEVGPNYIEISES